MTTTAKQIRLIERAFASIPELERNGRDLRAELITAIRGGEQQHRRDFAVGIAGGSREFGLSLTHAVKYFAVKRLKSATLSTAPVTGLDYLRRPFEVFFAGVIAEVPELRPKLDQWLLTADWADEFDALDYVELCAPEGE